MPFPASPPETPVAAPADPTPAAPAGMFKPEAAFKLPMGLLAEELLEARMRAYWYESAAMSAINFWVARARRRAR